MPTLYNTVGDLRFYNFISNRYPSGVPAALVRTFVSNAGVNRWMEDYAFTGTQRAVTEWRNPHNGQVYFTFPPVAGTPTANETITSTTTSNSRFLSRNHSDDRGLQIYHDSTGGWRVNTRDTGGQTWYDYPNWWIKVEGNGDNLGFFTNRFDWFTFCSKSPTTVVQSQIVTTAPMGSLESTYWYAQIQILGWMHDSVFPSPPVNETFRYSAVYSMRIYDNSRTSKAYNSPYMFRVSTKGSSGTGWQGLTPRYFDINCTAGNYSAGRFLTDLILVDNTSPFQQVGKIDNRLVCLGRGDFVKGRIYEVNNVFGRTGVEHWLCFCSYTPSSMAFPTWTPTTTLSADKWKYWNDANNETDYIMMRVFVEGDL